MKRVKSRDEEIIIEIVGWLDKDEYMADSIEKILDLVEDRTYILKYLGDKETLSGRTFSDCISAINIACSMSEGDLQSYIGNTYDPNYIINIR